MGPRLCIDAGVGGRLHQHERLECGPQGRRCAGRVHEGVFPLLLGGGGICNLHFEHTYKHTCRVIKIFLTVIIYRYHFHYFVIVIVSVFIRVFIIRVERTHLDIK